MLCGFGLNGVFAPVAGMIADRWDRRLVMISSDLAGAAVWAALAFTDRPALLVAGTFAASMVAMPFGNASGAAVPNIVEERGLSWANGLISAAESTARLAGPVIGGLVYVAGGTRLAFGLNTVSFLVSAALTVTVHARFNAPADPDGDAADDRGGWLAGFRVVFHDRAMTTLTVWWGLAYLALNTACVADLPLTEHFGVGSVGYSLIDTAFGGGLLLDALCTRFIRPDHEWFWVRWTVLGLVAGWATVAARPWFALVLVGQFVAAFIDSFGAAAGMTVYQRRAPDAVRGRALAAIDAVGMGANVVGFALAGPLVKWAGPQGFYALGAIVCAGGFLLLCTVPSTATRAIGAIPTPVGDPVAT
jgi:DHA3 family macrolide efflux protein-like MFS transporter